MKILATRIVVIDCPLTGYEESVEDKCGGCKYFIDVNHDVEVVCNYREED